MSSANVGDILNPAAVQITKYYTNKKHVGI
jgi:hypothetical protein